LAKTTAEKHTRKKEVQVCK